MREYASVESGTLFFCVLLAFILVGGFSGRVHQESWRRCGQFFVAKQCSHVVLRRLARLAGDTSAGPQLANANS